MVKTLKQQPRIPEIVVIVLPIVSLATRTTNHQSNHSMFGLESEQFS